jgi:uncharacterized membrane protein YfcA
MGYLHPMTLPLHWNELLGVGFVGSLTIGMLGGLIGLGGAEFRLPLVMTLLHPSPLESVVLNKALSLVVVISALPFRAGSVPLDHVLSLWPVILNVLAGSIVGAWIGASSATRLSSRDSGTSSPDYSLRWRVFCCGLPTT